MSPIMSTKCLPPVSILFGTSNSISLNLMLNANLKFKFNILPNDHKWLWHSQGLLNNPESVAIGGIKCLKLKKYSK